MRIPLSCSMLLRVDSGRAVQHTEQQTDRMYVATNNRAMRRIEGRAVQHTEQTLSNV